MSLAAAHHVVGDCIISLSALYLDPKTNNVKIKWALEYVGGGGKECMREILLETKWNPKKCKKARGMEGIPLRGRYYY